MIRLYKDPEGKDMFSTQRSSHDQLATVGRDVDLASQNRNLERRIIQLEAMLSQSLNHNQVILHSSL